MSAVFLYAIRFNTQPPEGGWTKCCRHNGDKAVSTHSRLKAAGYRLMKIRKAKRCFNTQPPEGGWPV